MFLSQIKITEDYRCLKKGSVVNLQPVTLLVGEQGSGKSTLLELIQQNGVDATLTDKGKKGVNTFYFDAETMNPRIQDIYSFTNPDGTNKGIGIGAGLASRFQSHGEILQEYTVNAIKDAENCIILLDEPETALSISNQFKLINEIKKAINRNVQFIIATHCYPMIESFENIFLMDTLSWVKSKEYIENIKNTIK